ncbi:MAG: UDP-N-acetylmuramoyl-tripeptide--D-alanyl-D-alanine ligase [Rickettsiales bacterium]|nr:UDP-N-acetylmuramoyl-tripeptide--D-alanyl-D-alanine ligase [Rickettsiales bacterium]
MKTLWTAREVAQATRGNIADDWEVSRVTIDSRTVKEGDLFVALKGDRFDGHDYVNDAIDKGAVAAVVSEKPEGVSEDKLVLVDDTEVALQDLGVQGRSRAQAQVVGVTGSVGKTGCKEMLKVALSATGSVYATQGNLNNHLGVPLTLANLPQDVEFAVIEMGMNHSGEIEQLSLWAKPDVSIITTVDAVHLEFFESVEAIADAKCEIFEGMHESGVALINYDNPHFERMQRRAVAMGLDRVLSFGASDDALCQLIQYGIEGTQSVVDASIAGTRLNYRLGAIGKHWGLMSVAVLGIVDALEADLPKAAQALEYFDEPDGRGRIEELKVTGGQLRLLDDAYNASPVSMQAAFEKMALIRDHDSQPVRTVAVLGDMLELGADSRDLHVGLVPTIVNNQIDLVFAAGQFMKDLYEALPESMRGDYDATAMGLAPKVVKRLQHRDLVLVKGSNGSKMSEVSKAIHKNASTLSSKGDLDAL